MQALLFVKAHDIAGMEHAVLVQIGRNQLAVAQLTDMNGLAAHDQLASLRNFRVRDGQQLARAPGQAGLHIHRAVIGRHSGFGHAVAEGHAVTQRRDVAQVLLRGVRAAQGDLPKRWAEHLRVNGFEQHMLGNPHAALGPCGLDGNGGILQRAEGAALGRGQLGYLLLQCGGQAVDQQRHGHDQFHLADAAGLQDGFRRAVMQINLRIALQRSGDHVGHQAEDMVERQEAQRALAAVFFVGHAAAALLLDKGDGLQADGAAVVYIHARGGRGARGAQGDAIRPAGLEILAVRARGQFARQALGNFRQRVAALANDHRASPRLG